MNVIPLGDTGFHPTFCRIILSEKHSRSLPAERALPLHSGRLSSLVGSICSKWSRWFFSWFLRGYDLWCLIHAKAAICSWVPAGARQDRLWSSEDCSCHQNCAGPIYKLWVFLLRLAVLLWHASLYSDLSCILQVGNHILSHQILHFCLE